MNNYVIYGKDNCIYCSMAKTLLEQKNIPYQYVDVPTHPLGMDLFKARFPGAKSFPQIRDMDDNWIGGYDDLVRHFDGR